MDPIMTITNPTSQITSHVWESAKSIENLIEEKNIATNTVYDTSDAL